MTRFSDSPRMALRFALAMALVAFVALSADAGPLKRIFGGPTATASCSASGGSCGASVASVGTVATTATATAACEQAVAAQVVQYQAATAEACGASGSSYATAATYRVNTRPRIFTRARGTFSVGGCQ